MLTEQKCDKITWINLESPTPEEVQSLVKDYHIHPLVAEELLSPTLRPKVDVFDTYLYLILHFPTVIQPQNGQHEQEIDFIIGKDFIITTRYQSLDIDNAFSRLLATEQIFPSSGVCEPHAGLVFFRMIKNMYKHVDGELDYIQKDLRNIEERIFHGEEHEMVKEISKTSRRLLDFKIAIRPHGEVLESFTQAGEKFFPKDFDYYLGAITAEYYKIFALFESSQETLNELRDTNDSLLNTKTNDIMRVLTILAFVTFPLSLVASIFGMNTLTLPVVGTPHDFWIIIGGMIVATLAFLGYFKYRKWL